MKHACFLDVAWNETAFDSPKIAKAIVANAHASGYVRCLKHVAGRENGFCVRFRRAGFCDFLTPTLPLRFLKTANRDGRLLLMRNMVG